MVHGGATICNHASLPVTEAPFYAHSLGGSRPASSAIPAQRSGCTRTEATATGGCGLTSLAFLLRPAALSLAWPHTPSPRASLLRQHELLHLEELRSRQLPKHAIRCSNSFVSAMHCNCHPGAGQTLTLQNGCVKEKTQPHQRLTAKPPSIFCRSIGKLIRTHAHVLRSSCARRSLRLNVAPLPATCPLRVRGL